MLMLGSTGNDSIEAARAELARLQKQLDSLRAQKRSLNCWRVTPLGKNYSKCRSLSQQISQVRKQRNIAQTTVNRLMRTWRREEKGAIKGKGGDTLMPPPPVAQAGAINPMLIAGVGVAALLGLSMLRKR